MSSNYYWVPDWLGLPDMSPAELLAAAQVVMDRKPHARLVKNRVGNLSILVGNKQVGHIDLRHGEVEWYDEGEALP